MNRDESILPSEHVPRGERWGVGGWFVLILTLHLAALTLGWRNLNLPGNEFRQAQTALSAYWIQQEGSFDLAYPTPVLGKPWSVPFEFPLYQWTVVAVSESTGYPLIQSGRLVSAVCFCLALPAVWLLLGRMGVAPARRWIVLGVVLSCPLYAFYGRAFLIETMALMFSLWFLQAFVAAVEQRSPGWAVVANLAGIGAGLVKVTTFMVYLLPAGAWALWWLWRAWRTRGKGGRPDRRELVRLVGWVAALVALPFAATLWWVHFADATKALNVSAQFARSAELTSFNFGTLADRLSAATWSAHWTHVTRGLVHPVLLLLAAVAAFFVSGRTRRWALGAAAVFAAVLLVFPRLYALHDYYFVASAMSLLTAVGLVSTAVFEKRAHRWLGWALLLAIPVAQGVAFRQAYFLERPDFNPGGSRLTEGLQQVTESQDVIVAAGMDWNSMLPYYSRRRALMLRAGTERDWGAIVQALDALTGETVGALVLERAQRDNRELLDLLVQRYDFDERPLFRWHDSVVYVPRQMRPLGIAKLHRAAIIELELPPLAEAQENPLQRHEVEVARLLPVWRRHLRGMSPAPIRFFSTFGLLSSEESGRVVFNAHPDTRLWFRPSAGRHTVRAEYWITDGAFSGRRREDATNGVRFSVSECRPDGSRRELFSRLLDPWAKAGDRGLQRLELPVDLPVGAELLLETGPGPDGNYTCDWASWGQIVIE